MIIIGAVFFVLLTIAVYSLNKSLKSAGNQLQQEKDAIESKLGKKIVMEKDTLQITDYSFIHQNYTLSNGKTISFALADSLLVK